MAGESNEVESKKEEKQEPKEEEKQEPKEQEPKKEEEQEPKKEEPFCRLKLVVDTVKNKVVLAEASKDFVDVLFSILALPMGTIVKLLEKHLKNPTPVGSFNSLYKSAHDLDPHYFTLGMFCKDILVIPRYPLEMEKNIPRVILDQDRKPPQVFVCPNLTQSCPKIYYSYHANSQCKSCGHTYRIPRQDPQPMRRVTLYQSPGTAFTITDDLKVGHTSMARTLAILQDLGYEDRKNFEDRHVYVSRKEFISLLQCLLTSEQPLTDCFLRDSLPSSSTTLSSVLPPITSSPPSPSATLSQTKARPKSDGKGKALAAVDAGDTLDLMVSTENQQILIAEGGHRIVDLLFLFLAVPLETVWKLTRDYKVNIGCLNNFCESLRSLRITGSDDSTMLPSVYNFIDSLLELKVDQTKHSKLQLKISEEGGTISFESAYQNPNKTYRPAPTFVTGFVNPKEAFSINDQLQIAHHGTAFLTSMGDVMFRKAEVRTVTIRKKQAIRLLAASLISSTALTTAGLLSENDNDNKKT